MYKIRKTKNFLKSYRKIKLSGLWNSKIQKDLNLAINLISQRKLLPRNLKDHQLKGSYKEYRECHIKGDLLLVYQVFEKEFVLVLIDIGSHSYLSL